MTDGGPAGRAIDHGAPTERSTNITRKRRGGRRGNRARRLGEINAKARERQRLLGEGGHPVETYKLTVELNGREDVESPEGLFADLRDARRRDYAAGAAEGAPFRRPLEAMDAKSRKPRATKKKNWKATSPANEVRILRMDES